MDSQREPAQAGWLPMRRSESILPRAMDKRFMKARKDRDWFMSLALAITNHKDSVQGKMVGKLYLFLRDFHPQGLTGRFAHICGEDVINYLLCHNNETSLSRHKLTRDIHPTFDQLETWMQGGEDWQAAVSYAKSTESSEEGGRRRHPWKAPFLLSPAGMLALLTIAHPDVKLKERIEQLQIGWMMDCAQETLDVQEGFWKGVNATNVHETFIPEDNFISSKLGPLMDYTVLFGQDFIRWRKDMRPFLLNLGTWAQGVSVEGEPSDLEEDSCDAQSEDVCHQPTEDTSQGSTAASHASRDGTDSSTSGRTHNSTTDGRAESDAPESTDPGSKDLRRHLRPTPKEPGALQTWLGGLLGGASDGDVLLTWCQAWAQRMDSATHYDAQLLTRSLFLQSLARLESFWTSSKTEAEAYVVLDIEDTEPRPPRQIDEEGRRVLQHPLYTTATHIYQRLAGLADEFELGPKAKDTIQTMSARLANLFHETFIHPAFFRVKKEVLSLCIRRTQMVIQDLQSGGKKGTETRDRLFDTASITALQLTNWQLQTLLVPCVGLEEVLTDAQLDAHSKRLFGDAATANRPPVTPQALENADYSPGAETVLRKLFGKLPRPRAPAIPTPAPPSPLIPSCSPPPEASMLGSSPKPDSSTPFRNAFAGRKASGVCLPRKRPGSPDPRGSKARRVDSTAQDLVDKVESGFKTLTDKLESEVQALRAEVARDGTQLRENIQDCRAAIKTAVEPIQEELQTFRAEVSRDSTSLRDDIQACRGGFETTAEPLRQEVQRLRMEATREKKQLRDDLHDVDETCGEVKIVTEQLRAELRAGLQSLQDEVSNIVHVQSRLCAVEISLGSLQETQAALVRQARPQLGRDGYLSLKCPAPATWDQSSYDAMLQRAGWFYIQTFGFRDEGASPDEDALEATKARFPHAPEEHIVTAINHAHIQGYNRPFCLDTVEE